MSEINNKKLLLFENQEIRSVWDAENEEWYFSIVDVVGALTDAVDYNAAKNYWKVTKHRMIKEGNELVTNCNQLKLKSPKDGKSYLTDVANAEELLRIIQSIPSKKAEPFKLWLAKVGKDRLEEIAGNARKELEAKLGRSVISSSNAATPELLDDLKKIKPSP
ncbi:MAG: hypothetical protein IJE49_06815 [Agathobacter sp.]|nr:hypothetical protein [Agathobacter sp.]